MTEEKVTLTIQGLEVTVPKGTMVVDAAKKAGVYIPVFCYHPKLGPVGMCRMCLVEIGRPKKDRQTGEWVVDDHGERVIEFGPKLEIACATEVGEGWVVHTTSPKALEGQRQIIEYLLTSHPLDCPVCDKGGECPLQELTMDFGSGKSRFLYDEKMHLQKHVPLGDLIFLDRERCIQCGRCVRYQEEVVDDPVIGFEQRGRSLQIVTYSDPGFNSYFSGNTTDICPVGALTSADFRFEARPWELKTSATVCPHCPVGCNLTVSTRRQPNDGGQVTVQRVMPRQNESINEIWICDKGRFAHHFAGRSGRLTQPMIRRDGELVEVGWDEALETAAKGLKASKGSLVGLAGGRAANEDLFAFHRLVEGQGGRSVLADEMAGGEWVKSLGVGQGTNLGDLAQGDAVLVVASDLREEAPIWWLRLKQAADRGATLVVAHPRPTRLDKHAAHTLRYAYGHGVDTVSELEKAVKEGQGGARGELAAAAKAIKSAENLLVFFGREGLDLASSASMAAACGSLIRAKGGAGRPKNGLIAVWPKSNTQGALDMGFSPAMEGLGAALQEAKAVYVVAADPVAEDPTWAAAFEQAKFRIVQELFLTPTARMADVIFPAQSYLEREGTYTSGERRLQRFCPATQPVPGTRADWEILRDLGRRLGLSFDAATPASVLRNIASEVAGYEGVSYQALAQVQEQWPPVGGDDLYFGGTSYPNLQGLGVQLPLVKNGAKPGKPNAGEQAIGADGLWLVPVTRLLDRGTTVTPSEVLAARLQARQIEVNPQDGQRLGLQDGAEVEVSIHGQTEHLPVVLKSDVPLGSALLPRSVGLAVHEPMKIEIKPVGEREA